MTRIELYNNVPVQQIFNMEIRVRCAFCSMEFSHERMIKSHVVETGFHNKFISIDAYQPKRQAIRCTHCKELFPNMEELRGHIGPSQKCYIQENAEILYNSLITLQNEETGTGRKYIGGKYTATANTKESRPTTQVYDSK